jgi:hypothetical protein
VPKISHASLHQVSSYQISSLNNLSNSLADNHLTNLSNSLANHPPNTFKDLFANSCPIDPSSPLFLHSGDNLGIILVPQPLIGENYSRWSRSMLIALSAKNKLCFIDGSLSKPYVLRVIFMLGLSVMIL